MIFYLMFNWSFHNKERVLIVFFDKIQEEVGIAKDGLEETVSLLEPNSSFGDISIVCNIPQPYTVRVCELCRLLRIDKQSFANILEIYFHDGRRILSNLLQVREMRRNLFTVNLEVFLSLI